MYIDIFPYDRSFDNLPVTYFVPGHLTSLIFPGICVEIPWKNSLQRAIVLGENTSMEEIPDNIKPITQVYTSFPLLHSEEIETIRTISSYFFLPIHTVLQVFIPKPVLNYGEKKNFLGLEGIKDQRNTHTPVSLTTPMKEIEIDLTTNTSTLFLLPSKHWVRKYAEIHKENTEVFATDFTTPKRIYDSYKEILTGESLYTFSTHKALTFRIQRYEKIVYIDALNSSHIHLHRRKIPHVFILEHLEKLGYTINIQSIAGSVQSIFTFLGKRRK